jgi:hypothetical protein
LTSADREPKAEELTSARVVGCVPFPTPLVAHGGCDLQAAPDGGASPIAACATLAVAHEPTLEVITAIVYRGRGDFAKALGIPSMQQMIDAGPEVAKIYREFEGPHAVDAGAGRVARVEARGLMMAGAIYWATLPSPHETFDTVLTVHAVMSDYPVTKEEHRALRNIDAVAVARCIDAALWPGSK